MERGGVALRTERASNSDYPSSCKSEVTKEGSRTPLVSVSTDPFFVSSFLRRHAFYACPSAGVIRVSATRTSARCLFL